MKLKQSLCPILSIVSFALAQGSGTYSALPAVSPNPSNVQTYIYLPRNVASNPPLVVVPHWCHGSAQAAYQGSGFTYHADTYGYIVIYPDSPWTADKCWDISSNATLTHNGGGDSQGIISAVQYVVDTYNVDTSRIFVQGTSSGAMMTETLLGAYPDVFAAGSAWAGVPFGCFGYGADPAVQDYWNAQCATGQVVLSGDEWAAIVQSAHPSYHGWRPKLQLFHGSVDETLDAQNLEEAVKEWTTVLGLGEDPDETLADTPVPNWTMDVWNGEDGRPKFEATLADGVSHSIQTQWQTVYDFFDLECSGDCFGRPDGGMGASNSRSRRRPERIGR